MNDEVTIWQFMAFKIADALAKANNTKLTYDMVKIVETQLREINEQYIIRIYFTMVNPQLMIDINNKMAELMSIKNQQGLNSPSDTNTNNKV